MKVKFWPFLLTLYVGLNKVLRYIAMRLKKRGCLTKFTLFTLIFRRRSMLFHMTNYSLDYIVMVYVALCLHGYEIISQRTCQTRVDSSLSDVAYLASGVVQGSGIGPLMFLIYLNELIAILENHGIRIKVFADDVKMYLSQ